MDATPPSLPRHAAARRPVGPIGRLLGLVAGGLFAATFAGWCGRWHWIAELAGHFSWYWFGIAMAGFAVAVVAGRRRTGIALAAAMVLNAWPLVPYWLPAAAPPLGTAARAAADADAAAPAGVSIVSLNLLASNRDTGRVVAYLRDRRADLVALLEVDDFWAEAIAGLADLYPHRFVVPRNDNFGIALLSRLPLDAVREAEFGAAGVPTIVADVPRPDGGDFNATPWSPVCRDFAARSGLVDTALGRGLQTTWNARLWLPRIPIDHVYAPPRTMVVRRAVGPDVGSDHLPVEAEIILPRHDDMTGGIR